MKQPRKEHHTMASKISLILSVDDEVIPPDRYEQAITETLDLLRRNGIGPTNKVVFSLVFDNEDDAIDMRNELKVTLGARPSGVDADVKFETKEGIERAKLVKVTPMDRAGWTNDLPRSVTVTSDMAKVAAEALKGVADKYGATVELRAGE
jgi:hypothetical protein